MANSDYYRILELVNRARARWKVFLVLEGILYTCAVLLAGLFLGVIADNVLHLPMLLRAMFLAVLICLAAFLFYKRILSSLLLPISSDEAALYIESRMKDMDNRLINSLQLGRSESTSNRKIIEFLLRDTLLRVRHLEVDKAVDKKRTKKYSMMLLIAALATFIYWAVLPMHFSNALSRLTHLRNAPAPITTISFTIKPGNVEIFEGEDLSVTAEPANGAIPEAAFIEYERGENVRRERMPFDGNGFNYTISNVQSETYYTVSSGDFKSDQYRITTITPLRIDKIDIVFTFPKYLRITGPFTLLDAPEELRVIDGTHAEFHVFANRKAVAGKMQLNDETFEFQSINNNEAIAETTVWGDLVYSFLLTDKDDNWLKDDIERRIYSVTDEDPSVEFLEPAAGFRGSVDKELNVIVKARDDVALASLGVFVGREGGNEEDNILERWNYNHGPNDGLDSLKTVAVESLSLKLSDHFQDGDSGYIYAEALDMKGSVARSGRIAITIISQDEQDRIDRAERRSVLEKLREILDIQVYARRSLDGLRDTEKRALDPIIARQHEVYNRSATLIELIDTYPEHRYEDIQTGLSSLTSDQMVDAVRLLDILITSFSEDSRKEVIVLQREIEDDLRRLLGDITIEEEEEPEDKRGDESAAAPDEGPLSALKDLLTSLRNFIAEQKRVIASTEELAGKKPEDFTEEDEDLKRKLHAIEDQWARFLEEESNELDKIPEQDFSKPSMLKELRQIYEEVDIAADELSKPGRHLPVAEEQIGLELAEKLEAKLESWLVNESDKIKWDLEEPSQDFVAPMAELPEELEDLIGDLIRQEEELDPEMEDVSSSWMDSLDKGAGWGTSDGPISNMSAKGKTGNTLPNTSEISGRSGEGRQGKSNGEFVSDTAIGKGGRRTPTRLMNEPYEQGVVNDEMTQETGGATGGGKLSGEGGEGVRGHVPPEVQLKISKVGEKYSDIINRGERIAHQVNKFGFSSEKLDETIELMRTLDYSMRDFKYTDVVGVHRQIVEGLDTSKDLLGHETKVRREEGAHLPRKVRRLLNNTLSTDFPEDYEELLKGYYRSISR